MADAKLVVQIDGQDNLSDELKKIESGVIRFVGAVSSALTAISAFAFPVIGAAQFQKELLNAAKTTDFVQRDLVALKKGLIDLSTQINVTAVDLAKIATMGGQIGIGKGDPAGLLEFTKTVSTAVSALDLDAEQVVTSFGKLINIFNIPTSQFRNALSALNEVSNASNATADQLFDVVRRIGNLGGSVKLPEAVALSATLIDLGLTAETAGTTITKIFADFKSSAGEFAAVVKDESIRTTKDWIDLVQNDGLGALTKYIDALNNLDVESASATKGRLTGEGRLFEAVTKLQEQRKRQLAIENQEREVRARILRLQESGIAAGDKQLAGLEAQANALRDAAVEANVLSRLAKDARTAFLEGDSAEKEQRTVLGGLSAQWTIFLNNIKALAIAAGDTFLPPLTEALKAMSAALSNPVNSDSLRRAGEDILGVARDIIDIIKDLRSGLEALGSSGIDWGAILRLTALVAAFATLKAFISIFKSLGANLLVAIPPLNAFGAALFGAVQQVDNAGKAIQGSAQSTQRVGGVFNNVAAGVRNTINTVAAASQQLVQAKQRVETLVANTAAKVAASQAQIRAVFNQNRLASLQDAAAIQARIASQQQALAAAQAAGNANRARSLKGDITYLTNQLAAIQAATAASGRYTAQVDKLGERLRRIDADLGRISAGARFTGMIQAAQRAGASVASAFATNFNNGIQTGFGTQARSIFGAIFNTAADVATTAIRGIGPAIGGLILKFADFEQAWTQASTKTAKGLVAIGAGFVTLGRAVGFVFKSLLSLANIGFAALFLVDVLKAIGLWDKLAGSIGKVVGALGFNVPNFLKSDKELRQQAEQVAAINSRFEEASKSASRFNSVMKAVALVAQNQKQVIEDVSFTPQAPDKAEASAREYFEALFTGYAKLNQLTGENLRLEVLIAGQRKRVAEAQKSLKDSEGLPSVGAASLVRKEADDAVASLNNLLKQQQEITTEISSIGNISAGIENVAKAYFTSAEAAALFNRNTENGQTLLLSYASNLASIRDLAKDRALIEDKLAKFRSADGTTTSQAASENLRLEGELARVKKQIEGLIDKNTKYEATLGKAESGAGRLTGVLRLLNAEGDNTTMLQAASALQNLETQLKDFQGLSIPKVQVDDVFGAATQVAVLTRVRSMYKQWEDAARTAADRAKNYASQAQGEVEKLLRNTEAFIDRITQTAKQKAQLAKNQVQDRTDDAASRQTLRNVQTQYDIERALLEQKFGQQQRVFSEQIAGGQRVFNQKQRAYSMEQQAMFQLEERYNAIKQAEEDRLNLQKQRRGVQQELKEFDDLTKKIKTYKANVEAANAVIANPNAKPIDIAAALTKRTDALEKLKSTYSLVETAADRLASKDPIGGQFVIQQSELNRVKQSVDEAARLVGQATLDGANNIQGAYAGIAKSFADAGSGFDKTLSVAKTQFEQLSVAAKVSAAEVASIVAQTSLLPQLLDQVAAKTQTGLLDFGKVDTDAIRGQFVGGASEAAKEARQIFQNILTNPSATPIKLTVDQEATAASVLSALQTAQQRLASENALKASVSARLSEGSLTEMKGQVEKLNPQIDATLNVKDIKGTNGTFTVGGKARGGLIGEAVALGTGIARFASGGRVKGPGGPKDDRVLAALSHGEFVMDALTTSRFGPGFFESLQRMARGGLSANFLSRFSMPKFAVGGIVGAEMLSGFAGIANDFNSSANSTATATRRDVVDINLSDGTRRATIQAEREQAKTLVSILSSFQKGK